MNKFAPSAIKIAAAGLIGAMFTAGAASAHGASAMTATLDDQPSGAYTASTHYATSAHDAGQAGIEARLQFQAALREHAALTVPALKAELLQEPERDALMNAVELNNQAVIAAVGAAYPGTQNQFADLWRAHIQYYLDYLHAAQAGDEAGKAQAKQNLANFTFATSDLLAGASPRLNPNDLQPQLATHGDQVTAIIDNLVAGNYPAVYDLAHQAYEHAGMMGDTLAAGRAR
jgi:hypothetical protein